MLNADFRANRSLGMIPTRTAGFVGILTSRRG
jgi:hypothetical protein